MICLISAQKHRLYVLVRTASSLKNSTSDVNGEAVLTSTQNLCLKQKCEKYLNFYLKTFSFW